VFGSVLLRLQHDCSTLYSTLRYIALSSILKCLESPAQTEELLGSRMTAILRTLLRICNTAPWHLPRR
jgi:hypothetical protein